MNLRLEHAWLTLGIIFIVVSLPTLLFHPNLNSGISVACGLLISFSSIRNLGGWRRMLNDLFR